MKQLLRQPGTAPRVHVRIAALLMCACDVGGEEIAATLGNTRRTVTNLRARWNHEGRRAGRLPRFLKPRPGGKNHR